MKYTALVLVPLLATAFAQTATPDKSPVLIPAGTHVLMELVSPLNTVSATDGSAVYLQTVMPVIVGNRVVIPQHTQVTGTVVEGTRPGRVKGRARLRMQFTNFIFADNRVVEINGSLQSLPGSPQRRTVDAEGTLEPVDQIDRDMKGVAAGALPGAVLGALTGGRYGLRLGLLGGGLGIGKALATRGDEIALHSGTRVEMVLKRELQIN